MDPLLDVFVENETWDVCKSHLRKIRSSRSQIFFKIGVLKNFVKFRHNACNFVKKRLQHRCFPMKIAKIFKNTYFYRAPLVAASKRQKQPFMKLEGVWKNVSSLLVEVLALNKRTIQKEHLWSYLGIMPCPGVLSWYKFLLTFIPVVKFYFTSQ